LDQHSSPWTYPPQPLSPYLLLDLRLTLLALRLRRSRHLLLRRRRIGPLAVENPVAIVWIIGLLSTHHPRQDTQHETPNDKMMAEVHGRKHHYFLGSAFPGHCNLIKLPAARPAPASPEINQHRLALDLILSDSVTFAMTQNSLASVHHVTVMSSDARTCLAFYRDVLGLRLVKRTVNFDDPGTWHLYFGDEMGRPGTILSFFPTQGLPRGRAGIRQVTAIRLAISPGTVHTWHNRIRDRATQAGITLVEADPLGPPPALHLAIGLAPEPRPLSTGEVSLRVFDPDGLAIDIVEAPYATGQTIAGVDSILIEIEGFQRTSEVLLDHLGFQLEEQVGPIFRHRGRPMGLGSIVDVKCLPGGVRGYPGAGTVHHVAFRAADDAHLMLIQQKVAAAGFNVTPILDRTYFRSIYFREPGGVLFEVATDPPGFAVDEAPEALGSTLKLPAELESRRDAIEAVLPPLEPLNS
jgi:glyoxalase family protein